MPDNKNKTTFYGMKNIACELARLTAASAGVRDEPAGSIHFPLGTPEDDAN